MTGNLAELRRLQSERQAALEAAISEAPLVQAAEIKGEKADVAERFTRRNFELLAFEIARMPCYYRRLQAARKLVAASQKAPRSAAA